MVLHMSQYCRCCETLPTHRYVDQVVSQEFQQKLLPSVPVASNLYKLLGGGLAIEMILPNNK